MDRLPATGWLPDLDLPARIGLEAGLLTLLGVVAASFGELGDRIYEEGPPPRALELFADSAPVEVAGAAGRSTSPTIEGGCGPVPVRPASPAIREPRGVRVVGGGRVTRGSVADAEHTLNGARPRVVGCYRAALATKPDMQGRVTFALVVGRAGAVTSVETVPTDGITSAVAGCLRGVLSHLRFAEPRGGEPANITGSFAFINVRR